MDEKNLAPTGLVNTGPSILGESELKLPVSGRIRPGIMVLTKAAAGNRKAKELYMQGIKAGMRFDVLGKQIQDACKFEKRALAPQNIEYFRVLPSDFAHPSLAKQIMDTYGEDRGSGRHLYRFPVVFPMDSWLTVIPHQLATYTFGGRKYWSEYGPDGKRHCKCYDEVKLGKNEKAPRVWGGRPIVDRPWNKGICDPDKCAEYQKRECNFMGRFLFYMPAVLGAGVIELPTKSFYAMEEARRVLEMVYYIRSGKISGTVGGKPIFHISKTQQDVSRIDDKGQAKRVKQWIITLEADVEMVQVFRDQEMLPTLANGQKAAQTLSAPAYEPETELDEPIESAPIAPEAPAAPPPAAENAPPPDPSPGPPPDTREAPPATGREVETDSVNMAAIRKTIWSGIDRIGIDANLLFTEIEHQSGQTWDADLEQMKTTLKALHEKADKQA